MAAPALEKEVRHCLMTMPPALRSEILKAALKAALNSESISSLLSSFSTRASNLPLVPPSLSFSESMPSASTCVVVAISGSDMTFSKRKLTGTEKALST